MVSPINYHVYKQLYLEHIDTLSCPCSRIAIPYRDFMSSNITFHPVCNSMFVSEQWTEALYLPNASWYAMWNFQATAHAQVCIDFSRY